MWGMEVGGDGIPAVGFKYTNKTFHVLKTVMRSPLVEWTYQNISIRGFFTTLIPSLRISKNHQTNLNGFPTRTFFKLSDFSARN